MATKSTIKIAAIYEEFINNKFRIAGIVNGV
jgi:hypothetical protein